MADTPTERPLPFSSPLVPLVVDGTKTETRRIIGVHNAVCDTAPLRDLDLTRAEPSVLPGTECAYLAAPDAGTGRVHRVWPRWQPGDLGWVRETWKPADGAGNPPGAPCVYAADWPDWETMGPWKPSIHFPKRFTRQWVRCRFARFERVQDISEGSARAEGAVPFKHVGSDQRIPGDVYDRTQGTHPYTVAFASLWDDINKPRGYGWVRNPPVLVIGFEALAPEQVEEVRRAG